RSNTDKSTGALLGKNYNFLLLGQRIRFGDRAQIQSQEHLDAEDFLPVGEGQVDQSAVVVGVNVLGGAGDRPVEEVEYLGNRRGLSRGHLERQRRQRMIAQEQSLGRRGDGVLGAQVKGEVGFEGPEA